MLHSRIRQLNERIVTETGPIVYWMSRDQRVEDNWALIYAQALAVQYKRPLVVIFGLVPTFLDATWRQYGFMLRGLEEVEKKLLKLQIPFCLLLGNPALTISDFVKKYNVSALVTDFSPLLINREWKKQLLELLIIPFYEVDAHNIVPCWVASAKQEFSARTLRPKLNKLLPAYLDDFPEVHKQIYKVEQKLPVCDWQKARKTLQIDFSVPEVGWCTSGSNAARRVLQTFVQEGLSKYSVARNNPNQSGQSQLSPYLHFGQISAQRIVLEVENCVSLSLAEKAAFLEELIVRRELADNFCFYNEAYAHYNGFPAWARKTLEEHVNDKRDFVYTREQFELGKTHDALWNSAQCEMVSTGKMHGFMRMYWAKKILEWTPSAQDALAIAIYLNDKYELDGRDPNGYAGIAWSIGGVHDRPWFQRPILGTVRYMNAAGCARKFDVNTYITKFQCTTKQ